MSDDHTTGNPPEADYPSRLKSKRLPKKCQKGLLNFQKLRKNVLLENIFENLEKYQFWKNVFFQWPDLTPRFDLNSTWNWPWIDPFPEIFQNCHVSWKNENFLKIPAIKMFWRNHESAWVTMSHIYDSIWVKNAEFANLNCILVLQWVILILLRFCFEMNLGESGN